MRTGMPEETRPRNRFLYTSSSRNRDRFPRRFREVETHNAGPPLPPSVTSPLLHRVLFLLHSARGWLRACARQSIIIIYFFSFPSICRFLYYSGVLARHKEPPSHGFLTGHRSVTAAAASSSFLHSLRPVVRVVLFIIPPHTVVLTITPIIINAREDV